MVQGTRRYDRLAEKYSQYRPRYPDHLISHLADIIAKAPASNLVVDVGYGTGIFTRQLQAALPDTMRIVGIEPSPSMRTQAVTETADHTGVAFGDGVAEHLPFVGDGGQYRRHFAATPTGIFWPGDRPRRAIPWSQVRFALDSPLEETGFEPVVPSPVGVGLSRDDLRPGGSRGCCSEPRPLFRWD
jgi:SAM-dependent methyltransferase